MKDTPVCKGCLHMRLSGRANITDNNRYIGGPRGYCMCEHPMARETFKRVCPRSNKLEAFIGFTKPGGNLPTIKTSPRWCPLREGNREEQKHETE